LTDCPPAALKLNALGVATSCGRPTTVSVTGRIALPPANANEIDVWYSPGNKPAILAVAVKLIGEVKLPVGTVSHVTGETALKVTGIPELTEKVCEVVAGTAP